MVQSPCNYLIYVVFNTNLLVQCFYLLIIAPKCFGLNC